MGGQPTAAEIEKKASTLSGSITFGKGKKEFFLDLLTRALGEPCIYCDAPLKLTTASVDHVIPFGGRKQRKDKELAKTLNVPANLQIICRKCNKMKGELPDPQFRALLAFLKTDPVLEKYVLKKLGQSSMVWFGK